MKRATRLPFWNVKVPASGTPPVRARNDVGVTLAGSIGSVNVTETGAVVPTPVALSAGSTLSTLGAVPSGDEVLNVDVKAAAIGLAPGSATLASTAMVNCVLTASAAAGVNVTTRSSAEIASVAGTAVAPAVSRMAAGVSVARFIGSEKVTVTAVAGSTPVAASAGTADATAGGHHIANLNRDAGRGAGVARGVACAGVEVQRAAGRQGRSERDREGLGPRRGRWR